MANRLSLKQKNEIISEFSNGKTVENLAYKFNCTKQTITRNLKKNLGEKKYKEIIYKSKSLSGTKNNKKINIRNEYQNEQNQETENNSLVYKNNIDKELVKDEIIQDPTFFEITPLIENIDSQPQKDLASLSLADIDFPKVVFMIVNKKIELEIRYLKDFHQWSFLSEKDLNRKVIEIFFDLKNAKRKCVQDHKVIKVPNPRVFKIVAPILISRGITRIISENQLISL